MEGKYKGSPTSILSTPKGEGNILPFTLLFWSCLRYRPLLQKLRWNRDLFDESFQALQLLNISPSCPRQGARCQTLRSQFHVTLRICPEADRYLNFLTSRFHLMTSAWMIWGKGVLKDMKISASFCFCRVTFLFSRQLHTLVRYYK